MDRPGVLHLCDTIGILDGLCHCPKYQCPDCGVAYNDFHGCLKPPKMPLTIRSIDATPTSPCFLIAEINGKEVGRMSISAMPLVHDMEIPQSTISRKIADALFHYACGKVKAAGFGEAVVIVENGNESMHRYVKERGAIEEPVSTVYMMEVK